MLYYVENRYGTAGMGNSYGYASVIESDEELETYSEQTGSLSGPYSREEAEARAESDNAIHDRYREIAA